MGLCQATTSTGTCLVGARYKVVVLFSLSCLLAFLKQQIMIDKSCHAYGSRCLIGVKTPSIILPFFNCPSNIIVMFDFHTFILFQLTITPFHVSIIVINLFRFNYNFLRKYTCVRALTLSISRTENFSPEAWVYVKRRRVLNMWGRLGFIPVLVFDCAALRFSERKSSRVFLCKITFLASPLTALRWCFQFSSASLCLGQQAARVSYVF